MKKVLILLLFFFSTQGFTASKSNIKVKVAMKPFDGDWMNESLWQTTLKEKLKLKYRRVMWTT